MTKSMLTERYIIPIMKRVMPTQIWPFSKLFKDDNNLSKDETLIDNRQIYLDGLLNNSKLDDNSKKLMYNALFKSYGYGYQHIIEAIHANTEELAVISKTLKDIQINLNKRNIA